MTCPARGSATTNSAAVSQHHCPAGVDRGGQRNGKERSDDRANERNEAHEPGEDAPQDGIGNADEPQPVANEDAKPSIEDGLHQEKAAQSCSRVVECRCAALQVGLFPPAEGTDRGYPRAAAG